MTYDVLSIASYITSKNDIGNLKLQKMLYILQAYFLVNKGIDNPLFLEDIEAWPYGPVVREVYNAFKCDRLNHIENICEEDKKSIDSIYDYLNKFTATQLVNLTHSYSPWIENWRKEQENIIPHFKNVIIPKNEIYNFHRLNGF